MIPIGLRGLKASVICNGLADLASPSLAHLVKDRKKVSFVCLLTK